MGADRKGPLAAFVVIAIIAAVLLVTSVRSQAAPRWLDPDKLPATIVAAPPAGDPHLWLPVNPGVPQLVQHGLVLAQKVTSDDATVDSTVDTAGDYTVSTADVAVAPVPSVDTSAPVTTTSGTSGTHQHATVSTHPARHHHAQNQPTHDVGPTDPGDDPSDPVVASGVTETVEHGNGHGHHDGWFHGHGHAHGAAPGQRPGHGPGHGHGHGQTHGQAHGHAHGHHRG